MFKRVGLACFLLLVDLLYFFTQYPDWMNRYVGHINIGNGNLDLLTKEMVDFRGLLFVFFGGIAIHIALLDFCGGFLLLSKKEKTRMSTAMEKSSFCPYNMAF